MIKYSLLIIIFLVFTTCKRYPEGGWSNVAKKHLFGGHKTGSSKTWHLKKYEVNGIDSTMFITPGNGYTSFENDEYTFRIDEYSKNDYYGKSKVYDYTFAWGSKYNLLEISKKEIQIGVVGEKSGTSYLQCSSGICERNIFNPFDIRAFITWKIIKLKSNEFIIKSNQNGNNYLIMLTH
jgi:hypothetical protein